MKDCSVSVLPTAYGEDTYITFEPGGSCNTRLSYSFTSVLLMPVGPQRNLFMASAEEEEQVTFGTELSKHNSPSIVPKGYRLSNPVPANYHLPPILGASSAPVPTQSTLLSE